MKTLTRIAVAVSFAALLIPSAASAATLTSAQISAIIGVLQSFGADAATVMRVENALNGVAPNAPSCTITASAPSVTAGTSFTITWNSAHVASPMMAIDDGTIRYAIAGTSGSSTFTAGPTAKQYYFALGVTPTGIAPFSPLCSVTVQKTS